MNKIKVLLKVVPLLFVVFLATSFYFALDFAMQVVCNPHTSVLTKFRYFFIDNFGGVSVILCVALYITWGVLIEKNRETK